MDTIRVYYKFFMRLAIYIHILINLNLKMMVNY